jgi:hypothetical protein
MFVYLVELKNDIPIVDKDAVINILFIDKSNNSAIVGSGKKLTIFKEELNAEDARKQYNKETKPKKVQTKSIILKSSGKFNG